ncbi:MAG: glycosyltransferase [Geminicoccaceae bacterium]
MSGIAMDYTIAIVTRDRPAGLARLLDALRHCRLPTPLCTVLVVDNDPARSAAPVVAACAAGHPLALDYLHEPRPGVVFARNAALDHARGTRLAFIDDDEEPDPGWLAGLAAAMDAGAAQAVSGPVRPIFARPMPAWFGEAYALCYVRPPANGSLSELMAGNLLLDRPFLARHGLRFPAALATHGAEDTALSALLLDAGGRLAWAADAVVREHIPAERLRLAWLLARWYRYGMSDVRIRLLDQASPAVRLRAIWRGVLRVGGGGLLLLLALPGLAVARPGPAVRCCYTIMRGLGMIAGALGFASEPYAVGSGRG